MTYDTITKQKDKKTDIQGNLERLNLNRPQKKLPKSWTAAAGIIRDKKQKRDLERHVRKMRAEWQ